MSISLTINSPSKNSIMFFSVLFIRRANQSTGSGTETATLPPKEGLD